MRTFSGITKKDARILITATIPAKRALAKKQQETGENRLWGRFAEVVDKALVGYGAAIYLALDEAQDEVNQLEATLSVEELKPVYGQNGEKILSEFDLQVIVINTRINEFVREQDTKFGQEPFECELDDSVAKWLVHTWKLNGGFDDNRDGRHRFMRIDVAIAALDGKVEPILLKKLART